MNSSEKPHGVIWRQMLVDWEPQIVSSTDDVLGFLQRVLDLARSEKCRGSCILIRCQ